MSFVLLFVPHFVSFLVLVFTFSFLVSFAFFLRLRSPVLFLFAFFLFLSNKIVFLFSCMVILLLLCFFLFVSRFPFSCSFFSFSYRLPFPCCSLPFVLSFLLFLLRFAFFLYFFMYTSKFIFFSPYYISFLLTFPICFSVCSLLHFSFFLFVRFPLRIHIFISGIAFVETHVLFD